MELNMSFIESLFNDATAEEHELYDDGTRRIYKRLSETGESSAAFDAVVGETPIGKTRYGDDVLSAFFKAARAYEKQGFINGVRYGIMMMRELGVTEGNDLTRAG